MLNFLNIRGQGVDLIFFYFFKNLTPSGEVKFTEQIEKSRNKAKKISENFEIRELVLISNHTKVLKNSDYIVYNPPQGLKKCII